MYRLHVKILSITLMLAFASAHAAQEEVTFKKEEKIVHKSGGVPHSVSFGAAALMAGIYWKARKTYPMIQMAEAGMLEYGGYVVTGIKMLVTFLKNVRKTQPKSQAA